jgi:tRNA (guanosine-2'-O-)-methyltransferase
MTPERFAKLRDALSRRQPDLTVLADGVNKTHNVSAILRTADAVGIAKIHAISDNPTLRRHHMIAGGAKQWVEVVLHHSIDTAVAELKSGGWRLISTHPAPNAVDFRDADYTEGNVALMIGAELRGLSPAAIAAADVHVRIPMQGLGTSVNVSVAAAVILFEAERQRRAAGLYDRPRLDADELERTLFEWSYPEIAALCRKRGEPYPPLTADGYLASNSRGDRQCGAAPVVVCAPPDSVDGDARSP